MKSLFQNSRVLVVAGLVLSLTGAACSLKDVVGQRLDTCETSHEVRLAVNDFEDALKVLLEKVNGGMTGYELQKYIWELRATVSGHSADRSPDFLNDMKWDYCKRYESANYTTMGDCMYDGKLDMRPNFSHLAFLYAAHEVERLMNESLSSVEDKCQPGVVYEKQPDGSTKLVDSSCANKEQVTVLKPGYIEARSLQANLLALAQFASFDVEVTQSSIEQALELIGHIRSCGVATYLAIKCTADSAFARLDQGVGKSKVLEDSPGLKSGPGEYLQGIDQQKNLAPYRKQAI